MFILSPWKIIVLTHSRDIVDISGVHSIVIPNAKKTWFHRLYYEYYVFKIISNKLLPSFWLSMHDITPRVSANYQALYCHNPSPFYKISPLEAVLDYKFFLFNLFYKYLYSINIKKNDFIIVQQNWIRNYFESMYKFRKIIVSYPSINKSATKAYANNNNKIILLYPSIPRVFKNFEVICEAIKKMPVHLYDKFEVRFTVDGTENLYSKYIFNRYKNITPIKFIGYLSKKEMFDEYSTCNFVLFPSKLETWGLPITEAINFNKPILVADLPYAHETVGAYSQVIFIDPYDVSAWGHTITNIVTNKLSFSTSIENIVAQPFAKDWNNLWILLMADYYLKNPI